MRNTASLVFATIIAITSFAAAPTTASSEPQGSVCSDCAVLYAAFSIANNTGLTVPYQVKWGKNGKWRTVYLANGYVETHTYPLNRKGRAPQPYVRIDAVAGDSQDSWVTYKLDFMAIGYTGYNSSDDEGEPMPYAIQYSRDGLLVSIVQD
jgi:hypothetical protein